MLNDVNSRGEGRGCAHVQLISDCITLSYLGCLVLSSCDLGKESSIRIGHDVDGTGGRTGPYRQGRRKGGSARDPQRNSLLSRDGPR